MYGRYCFTETQVWGESRNNPLNSVIGGVLEARRGHENNPEEVLSQLRPEG